MNRGGRLRSDPRRASDGGNSISEKRQPISKASDEQRDEVRGEPCVNCGAWPTEATPTEPMHLAARGYRGGCNSRLCVVAGCHWCHRDLDKDVGGRRFDLSTKVSGPAYAEKLAHMLEHYDGDWIAMGERLSGQRVVVVEHERAQELGL